MYKNTYQNCIWNFYLANLDIERIITCARERERESMCAFKFPTGVTVKQHVAFNFGNSLFRYWKTFLRGERERESVWERGTDRQRESDR